MEQYDFNNKTFLLLENSENGQVNSETIFKYKQTDNLVTADYYGGTVRYGKIVAILSGNQLDMLYQCITTDNELKAGKAIAQISLNQHHKIRLLLNWKWLTDTGKQGTSEYIEQ